MSDSELARELERLAGEVSSNLIATRSGELDESLDETLRRVLEAADGARIALFVPRDDGNDFAPIRSARSEPDGSLEPLELTRMSGAAAALLNGSPFQQSRLHAVPVSIAGSTRYALAVAVRTDTGPWSDLEMGRLKLIAELLATAVERQRQDQELRKIRQEPPAFGDNASNSRGPGDLDGFDEIIGSSAQIRACLMRIAEVAPTSSTVLLLGETGTGKELFARALHRRSARHQKPFVVVNCAALPSTLIESELFGHERGAFTGAVMLRHGRFEIADGGTLFLDEIGELPLEVQAKLLRVLQEGEFERLGSSSTRTADIRLIAATHRDLEREVSAGTFRADLFFRLGVFPIRIPPLRERRDDIQALTWFLIHRRQRALHRDIKVVPQSVIAALQDYDWPGNVRELENVIERALIRSTGETLLLEERLGGNAGLSIASGDGQTLDQVQRRHILEVLQACNWRINGTGNAAERLGLHPNTLRFRMQKLGIKRQSRSGTDRGA